MTELTASTAVPAASRPAGARRLAVAAGVSILLMAPFGMFGNVTVLGLGAELAGMAARAVDSTATVQLAVIAFVVVAILDVIAAWALARFFAPVGAELAGVAGWLRTAYAAVLVVGAGQLLTATTLAQAGAGDTAVAAGIVAFGATWQLGLVVFAVHLALLAVLVVRDAQAPSSVGVVLGIAAVAYAFDGIARLFLPSESIVLTVTVIVVSAASIIGEVGIAVWLLARGGRVSRDGRARPVRGR